MKPKSILQDLTAEQMLTLVKTCLANQVDLTPSSEAYFYKSASETNLVFRSGDTVLKIPGVKPTAKQPVLELKDIEKDQELFSLLEPELFNSQQKSGFKAAEAAMSKITRLESNSVCDWGDDNDFYCAVYKLPKNEAKRVGSEYIALMGDQGSWSGAAAIYNKVLVGSLNGIAAAAIGYLGGAASKELKKIAKTNKEAPVEVLTMNMPSITDNDEWCITGLKLNNGIVIGQDGDNGPFICTEQEYNDIISTWQAANPDWELVDPVDVEME